MGLSSGDGFVRNTVAAAGMAIWFRHMLCMSGSVRNFVVLNLLQFSPNAKTAWDNNHMPSKVSDNIFYLSIPELQRWSSGPVFCLLLGVSSDCAQPITGQVTEVTCPVIDRAQPELTPRKRQKTDPGMDKWVHSTLYNGYHHLSMLVLK